MLIFLDPELDHPNQLKFKSHYHHAVIQHATQRSTSERPPTNPPNSYLLLHFHNQPLLICEV
jgi:hypothetical protein